MESGQRKGYRIDSDGDSSSAGLACNEPIRRRILLSFYRVSGLLSEQYFYPISLDTAACSCGCFRVIGRCRFTGFFFKIKTGLPFLLRPSRVSLSAFQLELKCIYDLSDFTDLAMFLLCAGKVVQFHINLCGFFKVFCRSLLVAKR